MLGFLRELFTLSRAARLAQLGAGDASNDTKWTALAAAQRFRAAELLFTEGAHVEGLRLVLEALELAVDVAARVELEVPRSIDEAIERARRGGLVPALDPEIRPVHRDRFGTAARAARWLVNALEPLTLRPARLHFRRVVRAVALLTALAGIGVGAYFRAFPVPVTEVSASHERGNGQWPATFAYDGDPATEWLMEDHRVGFLELAFSPPRDLAAIRLLNGSNPPYGDRAVRDYRIEVVANSTSMPTSLRGTFEEHSDTPRWREIDLGIREVTLVRIHVVSFHGLGGSLAEVSVVEQ